jgi:hypothetical protein
MSSEKLSNRITAAIMVLMALSMARGGGPTGTVLGTACLMLAAVMFITGEAGANNYIVAIITGAVAGLLMLANLPVRLVLAVSHADAATRATTLADWTVPTYGAAFLFMALVAAVAAYGRPRRWGSDANPYGFRAAVFAGAGLFLLSHLPLRLVLAIAPPAAREQIAAADWSTIGGILLLVLAALCVLGVRMEKRGVKPPSDRTVGQWYGVGSVGVGLLLLFKVPIWILIYTAAPAHMRADLAEMVQHFSNPTYTAFCVMFMVGGVAVWSWATYRKAA